MKVMAGLARNPTLSLLLAEFFELWIRWRTYKTLFGQADRFALFNEASPQTRMVFDDALWDVIVLAICRLTDRSQSSTRKNARLNLSLIGLLKEPDFSQHQSDLIPLIEIAQAKAAPFRAQRDKRIAHIDAKWRSGGLELAGLSRNDVRAALAAIFAPLKLAMQLSEDTDIRPGVVTEFYKDELHFLNLLRLGSQEYARLKAALADEAAQVAQAPQPLADPLAPFSTRLSALYGPDWLRRREPDEGF